MTDKTIYKAGVQSASDPYEFIMSTSDVDRYGDIVDQDWNLKHFRKNPIALWNHRSDNPIGTWSKVRVEDGQLRGRLELAARGTSDLIDTLHSLVEQRVLKAVSVGFRPGKYEALDEDDPWGGLHLSENELLECSLCSVPANPMAISLAKSCSADLRRILISDEPDASELSASRQFGTSSPRDSGNPVHSPIKRNAKMSLSKKIETKQAHVNDLRNQLDAVQKEFDADADMTPEIMEQMAELSERIDQAEKELATLRHAEDAMKVRAAEQAQRKSEEEGQQLVPHVQARKNRKPGHNALATIATLVKAFGEHVSPVALAKASFRDDPEIEVLVKAATDPATMTDAAWAAPLVQETWGQFLDLIRDMSIYPALPGPRVEFDRFGKINIPRNNGRGKLAGGWVGELSPIPVKEGAYDTVDLEPKKLGVISSFSKEIAMHSIPAIQGLVQNQILEDTAESLDAYYLDGNARGATRPAGLQDATETGAGNINAATGATVAAVLADLKGMISRLLAARAGNGAVWVINPLNVLALSVLQDAASGEFVFKQELNSGTLMGYPMIVSQNIAADLLVLQGNNAMMFGNDYSPTIDVSREATLVFDDTAPEDIVDGGTATTQPTKSMFQVDGIAVKMTLGLDWRIVRTGGIQVLTTVAW